MPADCMSLYEHFTFTTSRASSQNQVSAEDQSKVGRAKLFVWWLLSRFPLRHGVLAGGVLSGLDRILHNLTHYRIEFHETAVDSAFRDEFLAKVSDTLNEGELERLRHSLPGLFFHKKIGRAGFPLKYVGSPVNMFYGSYLKILFLEVRVEFHGISHGGFYGEFRHNRVEEYEEAFSASYRGWGLGKENIRQNRFRVVPPTDRTVRRLFWVGSVTPDRFIEFYFPGMDQIYGESKENQAVIVPRLNAMSPVTYLKHPRQDTASTMCANVSALADVSEERINSSLFIIDKPGNTFLYRAIYEGIPFVLYFNRHWKEHFKARYVAFLDHLEENSLLYYWDQEDAFLSHVTGLLKEGVFGGTRFAAARAFLEDGSHGW